MISSALLHQLLQTAICFAEFETEVTETKGCRKARWRDQSKLDFAEYCGTNVLQGPSCCKSYVDSTCVWCFNWVRQRFSEDGAAPNLYRKKNRCRQSICNQTWHVVKHSNSTIEMIAKVEPGMPGVMAGTVCQKQYARSVKTLFVMTKNASTSTISSERELSAFHNDFTPTHRILSTQTV